LEKCSPYSSGPTLEKDAENKPSAVSSSDTPMHLRSQREGALCR
jgi:hypothetical protein